MATGLVIGLLLCYRSAMDDLGELLAPVVIIILVIIVLASGTGSFSGVTPF